MPAPKHFQARDARDRLIDLLGFGQTYPLRDIPVTVAVEHLTVGFDEQAQIDLDPAQAGVRYELYEAGEPVEDPRAAPDVQGHRPPYHVDGQGQMAHLIGPPMTVDRNFQISAYKLAHPERRVLVKQTATVKVGLNKALPAQIVTPQGLGKAAVVDHDSPVEVIISGSQRFTEYELVDFGRGEAPLSTAPVTGGQSLIVLQSKALTEDTTVRVRATRAFDPSEGRSDLIDLLDAVLKVAVRANPGLSLMIESPSSPGLPLVDPEESVKVTLFQAEESVTYTLFTRKLDDIDFADASLASHQVIGVQIPDGPDVPQHDVRVQRPPRPDPWQTQSNYSIWRGSAVRVGADLEITLPPPSEDSLVLIQAKKDHSALGLGQTALQIDRAGMVLLRPIVPPPRALRLDLVPGGDGKSGALYVSGGQQGVFYHFRLPEDGTEIGLPAYFHSPQRGIAEAQPAGLQVEMDFVIAHDPAASSADLDPIVDVSPLPGPIVSVTAVKARTGVGWLTSKDFDITPPPTP